MLYIHIELYFWIMKSVIQMFTVWFSLKLRRQFQFFHGHYVVESVAWWEQDFHGIRWMMCMNPLQMNIWNEFYRIFPSSIGQKMEWDEYGSKHFWLKSLPLRQRFWQRINCSTTPTHSYGINGCCLDGKFISICKKKRQHSWRLVACFQDSPNQAAPN